jgi:ribosomal-protein-serine acetyltransferase
VAQANDRVRLPERIEGPDGLVIRQWRVSDAAALGRAVTESQEHLHPWMAWAALEPVPTNERKGQIRRWRREARESGDAVYGVFINGQIAGGCGLHRRGAEDVLEIGYWIHIRFVRQGWATRVASLLTNAALATPGISYVEIHHDKANEASGRVPQKLGFALVAEERKEPAAPSDVGIDCRWRTDAESWRNKRGAASAAPH